MSEETVIFQGRLDRFKGVIVNSTNENCVITNFKDKLEASILQWKKDNKRTIWFEIALADAEWIPFLAKEGFKYHHASENVVTMYLWLPKDEEFNAPKFAHTLVGVGGLVINNDSQILVVKQKYSVVPMWRVPGGYVEPGENLVDAIKRELLEETNISTEFESVLGFGHAHKGEFDCSDLYFLISLKPTSFEIKHCEQEISECKWMDLDEYFNNEQVTQFQKAAIYKYKEYKEIGIKLDCEYGVVPGVNRPYSFYSVNQNLPNKY